MPQARGEIRFDNVSFGYERHRPVLKDVNFTIRPGEKIGIVGRSGSGKTTLVNLISRFYDVELGPRAARRRRRPRPVHQRPPPPRRRGAPGAVPVSRHDLRQPDLRPARSQRRWRRSRPPAPPRRTTSSCTSRWATTPGWANAGRGSPAAKSSASRSRGRCSTIPRVLILDEATSSVDTESEKAIQEALRVLDPRPHHAGDRASPEHAVRLGPHPRLRPGPPDRAGHPRRADARSTASTRRS